MQHIDTSYKAIISIAKKAGEAIMHIYTDTYNIEQKQDNSPVTRADITSNDILISGITQVSPYPILSEEIKDTGERLSSEFFWILDPLDGTKEFIKKNGEFSVMVGLVKNNTPVFGLSYEPVSKKCYYAQKGVGTFLAQPGNVVQKLHVSNTTNIAEMISIGSRSHAESTHITKKLQVKKHLISGGVGIKISKIAEKKADIYYNTNGYTSIWDTCAPQCILEAAGGKMTDIFGNNLVYNTENVKNDRGVLATNNRSHKEIVAQLTKTAL